MTNYEKQAAEYRKMSRRTQQHQREKRDIEYATS